MRWRGLTSLWRYRASIEIVVTHLSCMMILDFLYRFRLDRNTVLWLLDQLGGQLDKIQNKGVSVHPVIQLLVTLQFFGSGSFLRNIGYIFGLHISTISRVVYCCSRALASLYDQFIEFPHGAELQRISLA